MKIIAYIILIFIVPIIFSNQGFGQKAKDPNNVSEKMFAKNQYFSKGGIGIISKNFYIVVKSNNNELILNDGKRWVGKSADVSEVVIFYDGRIWSQESLPDGFDLSKTVVISFETNKIRFFDFRQMDGGYYKRLRED
jgi:hypothetical protein